MVNITSDRYNDDKMKERSFYRIAWNIHHMWEETGSSDSRLFMEPIVPDQFVVVGQSVNGEGGVARALPLASLAYG